MGIGDGSVLGTTKIVHNGSASARWNLVIVSEGYRDTEMPMFASDADNLVSDLFGMRPFSDLVFLQRLNRAINVYRVDVTSTDSGADDPAACGGSGATPATYFNASFCNSGIRRLLLVDTNLVIDTVTAEVPAWHAILVIVNSPIYGGAGGAVGTFSKAPAANQIGIHELGHAAFGLADEYEYWSGCGVDTDRNNHPPGPLAAPNVTTSLSPLKWDSLVTPGTSIPTTSNSDCNQCDPQASPVPAGTVGAFEGAHYYHCDAWRPEFNCMMRSLSQPFCAVCRQRIINTLQPFLPPPDWLVLEELLDLTKLLRQIIIPIDLVSDPVPFDLARLRKLMGRSQPGHAAEPDVLSALIAGDGSFRDLEPGALRAMIVQMKSRIGRLQAAVGLLESELRGRQIS